MLKIAIDKEISSWYGITARDIDEQLSHAQPGEEIQITINSPGGDVYTGVAIFNSIREAAKTHLVIVKIIGIAASMASYIMLAPRTVNKNLKIIVYENSIVFIHNPWTIMWGNYKELAKEAQYLEKLAAMMGSTYSFISGKTDKETRDLMDAETYYIGNEIIENGYANELEKINKDDDEPEENELDRESIALNAKLKIEKSFETLRATAKEEIAKSNFEKAAALIKTVYNPSVNSEAPISDLTKGSLSNPTPVTAGGGVHFENSNPKEGEIMNKEELQKKYPELYALIFNEGKEAGKSEERKRADCLLKLGETSGSMKHAAQFIREGKSVMDEDVQTEFLTARMNNAALGNRLEDDPPPVDGASGDEEADNAAQDAAWKHGVSGRDTRGDRI